VTAPIDRLRSALGDRYVVERQAGEGGMATVFLAKDIKHERSVAIKVLRPELSASLGGDRFLREIRVAATLQHPNILGLYDSGETEGLLYYVMPFVEGESLRHRLDREQQLPLHDALRITREAAEALQYAHEHNIIHRDIKPENILMLGGHALVADFGIARAVSEAGGEKLTQTGMAMGTPYYMSPEQALGSDRVDARSDVYSLGCVLYELLIGQPPFTGPNAMAIMARHSMEKVPSLQIVRSSVPDEVEDIVMHALEKTPADRFQTMQELVEALNEAEADVTMQRTAARRAATASRRVQTSATVSTPVAVPALRKSSAKTWLIALVAVVVLAGGGVAGWLFFRRGGQAGTTESGLDPNRIAVLYFEKGSGSSDSLGYLADGLTEALIHELSGVKGLQVISSNGVRPYKAGKATPPQIAKELQVGTLVQGSVAQSGDRLRLNVSLINPNSGLEIGSKTLERPRDEIFALQDDLANEVSQFLRQRLGQEVKLQESHAGTSNSKAWELLQQAQLSTKEYDVLLSSADTNGAARQFDQADSLLARAAAVDPKWSTPIVERGWLASRKIDLSSTEDKAFADRWIQRGLEQASSALKVNPNDASAIELRGTLEYWQWLLNLEPDQAKAAKLLAHAETDLRAAVSANPTAASAWTWLSHLLMGQSQSGEAKLAALRAYESDPYLSSAKQTVWRLFQASLDLEDQVEATHWCQEGQRRFPESHRFIECQIWLFALKGATPNVPKAWDLLAQYEKQGPPSLRDWRHHYGQMIVAIALARAGLRDSAKAVAVRSRGDASLDPTHDLDQLESIVHTILGEKDEAIRLLSTYLAANPQFRESMARDQSWWFRELRSDPRYQALVGGRVG
jgi:TolB-like protein/tRNA A-37 threonylcarbamoyl transferase component Bud32